MIVIMIIHTPAVEPQLVVLCHLFLDQSNQRGRHMQSTHPVCGME